MKASVTWSMIWIQQLNHSMTRLLNINPLLKPKTEKLKPSTERSLNWPTKSQDWILKSKLNNSMASSANYNQQPKPKIVKMNHSMERSVNYNQKSKNRITQRQDLRINIYSWIAQQQDQRITISDRSQVWCLAQVIFYMQISKLGSSFKTIFLSKWHICLWKKLWYLQNYRIKYKCF